MDSNLHKFEEIQVNLQPVRQQVDVIQRSL